MTTNITTDKYLRCWRAGGTMRWSCNYFMRHCGDNVHAHSARVTNLLLQLWGYDIPSHVLITALTHDDGECLVGDAPYGSKTPEHEYRENKARHDIWEHIGTLPSTPHEWRDRISICDGIDHVLMAQHHAPHLLREQSWLKARAKLLDAAQDQSWGVYHEVRMIIGEPGDTIATDDML